MGNTITLTKWITPYDINKFTDYTSISYNFITFDKPLFVDRNGNSIYNDGILITLDYNSIPIRLTSKIDFDEKYIYIYFQPLESIANKIFSQPILLTNNSSIYEILDNKNILIKSVPPISNLTGAIYIQYLPKNEIDLYIKTKDQLAREAKVQVQRRVAPLNSKYIVQLRTAIINLYSFINDNLSNQNAISIKLHVENTRLLWTGGINNMISNQDPNNINKWTQFDRRHIMEIFEYIKSLLLAIDNDYSNNNISSKPNVNINDIPSNIDDININLSALYIEKIRDYIRTIEMWINNEGNDNF